MASKKRDGKRPHCFMHEGRLSQGTSAEVVTESDSPLATYLAELNENACDTGNMLDFGDDDDDRT